jgi:hypothetical protein
MNQMIIKEVADLIAVGEKLCKDASTNGSGLRNERIQELLSMTARGGQLITRLYGNDSQYFQMFQAATKVPSFTVMHSNYYSHVSNLVGLFKGMQHDIDSGMLSNLRNLVQAEIFADFLEMAEHLLGEGYKDAAAVLLGAVLEDSLRKIADASGVLTVGSKGQPLTLDPLNVALAKKGVYGPLVQKQVTSWANLRNDAAHGYFANYDAAQVKQMLLFVQKFCADYLK